MVDLKSLRNLGRTNTSARKRGYVSLTGRRRDWDWFVKQGHVLPHMWERFKWYVYPKYFMVPKWPNHMEVEASAACQMRCPMCAQGKLFEEGLKLGNMEFDLFRKIVDEVHDKVYSIKLSWRGEPSLNPDLHRMLRYAKLEKNMKSVGLLTNMERYDEAALDELLDTGVDFISVSADGVGETYEKIRYPAKFEDTVAKVRYLRDRRDAKGLVLPLIRVQSLFSAIREDPEAYLATWEPVVDRVNFMADQWRASLDEEDYDLDPDFVCYMPFIRLAIGWNGKVTMCCNDYSEGGLVGDAATQSIAEIWHGEPIRRIRDAMKQGRRLEEVPPCRTCSLGAKAETGEYIKVKGRDLPVRINAGRPVEAKELDAKSHRWKKGKKPDEPQDKSAA